MHKVVNLLLTLMAVALLTPMVAAAPAPIFINTTHRIVQGTVVMEPMECSATAIGPHALLTASHCERPTSNILVDDKLERINAVIRDGWDHTIILLEGPEFKDYAKIVPNDYQTGDIIEYNGNPGELAGMFRRGYVSGKKFMVTSPKTGYFITMLDVNGFFGDSGAGVFNSKGELIGVISTCMNQGITDGPQMKLMGILDLRFSPDEYKEALTFDGK